MKEKVKFVCDGNRLISCLSGELDHHNVKEVRDEIDSMLYRKKPTELWLDFSGVKFMDSSGIGLIIGRATVAIDNGCVVRVSGMSEAQRKLVRLSGIEKISNVMLEECKK